MKYKMYIVGLMLYFLCNATIIANMSNDDIEQENQPLNIQYSPDLQNLMLNWINEYQKFNPDLSLNVRQVSETHFANNTYLSFLSGRSELANISDHQWKIVVGHDAVVPIVNLNNPFLKEIKDQGITSSNLAVLLSGAAKPDWIVLLDGIQSSLLKLYVLEDEFVNKSLAEFTGLDPELIMGLKASNLDQLLLAIEKNPYAIGFCRLKDIIKDNVNEWADNIMILPIDKNANRRIDNFENIYESPNTFLRGVWIGKYPTKLSGNIYAISTMQPTNEATIKFLNWILSDGSKYLNNYGYSQLASAEKQEYMDMINPNELAVSQTEFVKSTYNWVFILIGLTAFFIAVVYLWIKLNLGRSASPVNKIHMAPGLNENTIMAPKGLYFDKTHTWTYMEKEGLVKIGVDDFIQHVTGNITRVMMKEPGEIVQKGEKILTISHLGKQITLYSPITGIIKKQNKHLLTSATLVNTLPYTEGWIYLIEPLNWLREIHFMFMADTYKDWLKSELVRLKHFLVYAVKSNTSAYQHIILQDGGELHDNVLADLEPEVWEEFQTKFIDTSK
ncbi:hypothetical protein [Carboxylicivirga caseinilyticus]|uniref:hypothetical protein n=1 Tax=Carboxylicivirga caseinilyticus TaxID=3417572 RepID=UPI003D34A183|nr:hypothetical protein [Marinilabiliaceae bacterium A049]